MTNVQTNTQPNIWITALISGAIAAVANVIVYFSALAAKVPLQIISPRSGELEQLALVPVILASIVPAIPAAFVLLVLRRFTPRANLVFQIIAAVFLVVSFGGPLRMNIDDGTKFVLNLMHLIAGVVITLGLTRMR